MEQIEEVESISFKWGKKRGLGGQKKDVQFYESFTYDDVEYTLFDSVYMYMDGEPEPSIGKLIKIWEASDKAKKVKILWFFRPCEISNYIDVDKTLKNELFLASGEGSGLANVNPLEAIAGKCSVICISKDSRNLQPSHEELQVADFIFYRTFDVQSRLISDKIDDKIAGLNVTVLLNRAKKDLSRSPVPTESVPKNCESGGFTTFKAGGSSIDASSKEKVDHNLLSTNQKSPLEQNITASGKDLVDMVKIDHARGNSVGDESKSKLKEDAELINSSVKQKSSLREHSPPDVGQLVGVVKMNEPQKSAAGDKTDSRYKDKEIVGQKHSLVKQKSSLIEKLPSDVDLQLGGVVKVNEVRKTTAKEDAELINSSVKQKSSRREHSPPDVGQLVGVVKLNEPQKSAAGDTTDLRSKDKEIVEQKRSLVKQKSSLREKVPPDADVQLGGVVKVNEVQKNTAHDTIGLRSSAKEIVDQKHSLVKQKSSLGEKYGSNSNAELDERAKRNTQECSSGDKIASRTKGDHDKDENNPGKRVPANEVEVEEKVQATKDSGRVNDWPSKEAKVEGPAKASGENKQKIVQKSNQESHGIDFRTVDQGATTSENKHKRKFVNDLHGSDNISSKNPRLDKRLIRPANDKLPKVSPRDASNDARNVNNQTSAVSRRPTDKSKWFTLPPWEERLQMAHKDGRLVLLQNLDPSYAAAEVEDIVLRAFKENCAAKMIQQTAFSSPHSGQAFVIFRTREATEMVVTKLNEGCFLLPNGRPLVGSIATLNSPGKPSTFFGHVYVDKLRLQMQREMKEAVSTSHFSQPNTIEFDMAMDWRLLQERMDREWKTLYQQQRRELRKLQDTLRSK